MIGDAEIESAAGSAPVATYTVAGLVGGALAGAALGALAAVVGRAQPGPWAGGGAALGGAVGAIVGYQAGSRTSQWIAMSAPLQIGPVQSKPGAPELQEPGVDAGGGAQQKSDVRDLLEQWAEMQHPEASW